MGKRVAGDGQTVGQQTQNGFPQAQQANLGQANRQEGSGTCFSVGTQMPSAPMFEPQNKGKPNGQGRFQFGLSSPSGPMTDVLGQNLSGGWDLRTSGAHGGSVPSFTVAFWLKLPFRFKILHPAHKRVFRVLG